MEKQLIKAFYENLLEHYDCEEYLKADYHNVGAVRMVSGGCFAISYYDQRKDLEEIGYISKNSESKYSDAEIYEIYEDLTFITLEEVLG